MGIHDARALIPQSPEAHAQNQIGVLHSGINLYTCLHLGCVLSGFAEYRPRYFSLLKMFFVSADH